MADSKSHAASTSAVAVAAAPAAAVSAPVMASGSEAPQLVVLNAQPVADWNDWALLKQAAEMISNGRTPDLNLIMQSLIASHDAANYPEMVAAVGKFLSANVVDYAGVYQPYVLMAQAIAGYQSKDAAEQKQAPIILEAALKALRQLPLIPQEFTNLYLSVVKNILEKNMRSGEARDFLLATVDAVTGDYLLEQALLGTCDRNGYFSPEIDWHPVEEQYQAAIKLNPKLRRDLNDKLEQAKKCLHAMQEAANARDDKVGVGRYEQTIQWLSKLGPLSYGMQMLLAQCYLAVMHYYILHNDGFNTMHRERENAYEQVAAISTRIWDKLSNTRYVDAVRYLTVESMLAYCQHNRISFTGKYSVKQLVKSASEHLAALHDGNLRNAILLAQLQAEGAWDSYKPHTLHEFQATAATIWQTFEVLSKQMQGCHDVRVQRDFNAFRELLEYGVRKARAEKTTADNNTRSGWVDGWLSAVHYFKRSLRPLVAMELLDLAACYFAVMQTYTSDSRWRDSETQCHEGDGLFQNILKILNDLKTMQLTNGEIARGKQLYALAYLEKAMWLRIYTPQDIATRIKISNDALRLVEALPTSRDSSTTELMRQADAEEGQLNLVRRHLQQWYRYEERWCQYEAERRMNAPRTRLISLWRAYCELGLVCLDNNQIDQFNAWMQRADPLLQQISKDDQCRELNVDAEQYIPMFLEIAQGLEKNDDLPLARQLYHSIGQLKGAIVILSAKTYSWCSQAADKCREIDATLKQRAVEQAKQEREKKERLAKEQQAQAERERQEKERREKESKAKEEQEKKEKERQAKERQVKEERERQERLAQQHAKAVQQGRVELQQIKKIDLKQASVKETVAALDACLQKIDSKDVSRDAQELRAQIYAYEAVAYMRRAERFLGRDGHVVNRELTEAANKDYIAANTYNEKAVKLFREIKADANETQQTTARARILQERISATTVITNAAAESKSGQRSLNAP